MAIPFENRGIQTGTFHGPLPGLDDDARVIRYRMDDGPETVARKEVSGDVGGVNVDPVTDTNHTPVLWTANLDSSRDDVGEFYNSISNVFRSQGNKCAIRFREKGRGTMSGWFQGNVSFGP